MFGRRTEKNPKKKRAGKIRLPVQKAYHGWIIEKVCLLTSDIHGGT
jgi:hypothetical protein